MAQNVSEATLAVWSKGPSQTETDKCDNAARGVRNALDACDVFSEIPTRVIPQGSYRARTNVRQNSDVDVCVCYQGNAFFTEYQGGAADTNTGNGGAPDITFAKYKDAVATALTKYFGADGVTRGTKAFTVHENTYRIGTDVVPAFEFRCYRGPSVAGTPAPYESGIAFLPDGSARIVNWPEQTYANGVSRNTQTSRYYKRTIRILKRLRDKMQSERIVAANDTASFLIECLVWNAPLESFTQDTHTARVRYVLANVFNGTKSDDLCSKWLEVSNLKYLFNGGQPWTRERAHSFASAAWDYIGFK